MVVHRSGFVHPRPIAMRAKLRGDERKSGRHEMAAAGGQNKIRR
jgi:hypothetical protein